MGIPLLAQIPLVQGIREGGDEGMPVALRTDTMSGQAFLSFAQAVVTMVNRRNKDKEPTKIVEVKS